jgi:hypothetical protein
MDPFGLERGCIRDAPSSRHRETSAVDYSSFKALQFVLFFAPVFIFGFWQLRELRRHRRVEARVQHAAPLMVHRRRDH